MSALVPLQDAAPITEANASEYSSPPSLNRFRSAELRGPDSEPAVFYRRVMRGWINATFATLASKAPEDLPIEWDGKATSYDRASKRWKTLMGDGKRRVRQRKQQTERVAALAPALTSAPPLGNARLARSVAAASSSQPLCDEVEPRIQEPFHGQNYVKDRLHRHGFVDGSIRCTEQEYGVQCATGRLRRWSI